jgi:hypothetical protein
MTLSSFNLLRRAIWAVQRTKPASPLPNTSPRSTDTKACPVAVGMIRVKCATCLNQQQANDCTARALAGLCEYMQTRGHPEMASQARSSQRETRQGGWVTSPRNLVDSLHTIAALSIAVCCDYALCHVAMLLRSVYVCASRALACSCCTIGHSNNWSQCLNCGVASTR